MMGCFVLMQGTSRTYDPDKRERGLQQWCTESHDVVEARVTKKPRGPQPDGVLWMGPRGVSKIIKQVMVLKDRDL